MNIYIHCFVIPSKNMCISSEAFGRGVWHSTYIYTNLYVYIYTYIHSCIREYIYTLFCDTIRKQMHIIRSFGGEYISSHIYIHIYIYMYTYTYIHIYVNTYIHLFLIPSENVCISSEAFGRTDIPVLEFFLVMAVVYFFMFARPLFHFLRKTYAYHYFLFTCIYLPKKKRENICISLFHIRTTPLPFRAKSNRLSFFLYYMYVFAKKKSLSDFFCDPSSISCV